jgi:hypothetical protein
MPGRSVHVAKTDSSGSHVKSKSGRSTSWTISGGANRSNGSAISTPPAKRESKLSTLLWLPAGPARGDAPGP